MKSDIPSFNPIHSLPIIQAYLQQVVSSNNVRLNKLTRSINRTVNVRFGGEVNDLVELLLPEEEEYTCGLFRSRSGEIRSITIRRRLQGGYTCAGKVVFDQELETYLHQIAEALRLRGSINVQLKWTMKGPVAFEINPRFSSTVLFRHLLGFQDLIWAMKDLKEIDLEPYEAANEGVRFYRGPREYIVRA